MATAGSKALRRSARVRVPASSSNLGPGFDALGLALGLELEVTAQAMPGGSQDALGSLEGTATAWPSGADNLLLRAFARARRELGGGGAWSFDARSRIPLSRGLGSSGAAIVAGLLLGAALSGREVRREDLLAWALELEGHPDNVAPSLLGGCILSQPRAGLPPRFVRVPLADNLAFALAWPDVPLETSFARSLLPQVVKLSDAVENARQLALVLQGLERGDPELLAAGNEERLHVPYRLPHIPGGRAALTAALEAGAWLATISGSGSALLSICPHDRAAAVAQAMGQAFRLAGAGGEHGVLEVVRSAPEVQLL
jgi:homoserine kinase